MEEEHSKGSDISSDKISLSEFISFKQKLIGEAEVVCKNAYEERLKKELIHLSSSDQPAQEQGKRRISWTDAVRKVSSSIKIASAFAEILSVDEHTLADHLLTGKATLEQVHDSEQICTVYKTVKNVIEDYQGLYEEAFLLLNAPKGNAREGLPYQHEKDAREIQLNTFYKVVVGSQDKDKYPSMPIIADTYDDIVQGIECFLGAMACKAKTATIVYNGHGRPTGQLHLEREKNPPTNSKLLSDIHALWDQYKQKHQEDNTVIILPSHLTVVLAQCYGFNYSQTPQEKQVVRVVSLASHSNPTTTYDYQLNRSGHPYIESSVHFELDFYSRRRSEDSRIHSGAEPDFGISRHGNGDSSNDSSRRGSEASMVSCSEVLIPSLMVTCGLQAFSCPGDDKDEDFINKLRQISRSWVQQKRCTSTSISTPMCQGLLAIGRMSLDPSVDSKSPPKSSDRKQKCKLKSFFQKKKKATPTLDKLAKSTLHAEPVSPASGESDSD